MKPNHALLALLAAGLYSLPPAALAQSAKDFETLRDELRALRDELNQLKARQAQPSAAPAPNERMDALELKQKDAVVLGDIPGSLRLPGSETSIRLYGQIEANLFKDFKTTAPGELFSNIMEQPLGGGSTGKTAYTAQTSRFGFETSTPTSAGSFNTKLEADFYASCGGTECNRNRLRLRHAYGEYAGWTIGQTWSTFIDLDTLPETVDFSGPPGAPGPRVGQLRYTYSRPGLPKFQFALEDPTNGAKLPNLVARVSKVFDWGSLSTSLLSHEQRVDGVSKRGLGLNLGAGFKVSPSTTLTAQYTRLDGDGDAAFLTGVNTPVLDGNRLRLDRAQGLVLGLGQSFGEKLRANLALGMMRSSHKLGDAYVNAFGGKGNRQLYQWHAGMYYLPIKNVELGSELLGGRRRTFDGGKGDLLRLNLQARYMFN
ncbi:porin [Verminephrobacter aporrectodeae subsp. tuberculatae]|uniref:porin n=1 Tax=Verminephrobacter aporrectodeae TaxID=1110389 RepID=UPI002236F3AC|nr:porin [Verminephrobacter aporrectodeae]MCW5257451.1 porin [Verminephrobacter aporrectodeae subsp. tuberculatae]